MALELYMVGLVAQDMDKSVEFYRRLGLAVPADSAGQPHVEVKMSGGLTFFLNAPGRAGVPNQARVVLEFYLKERAAVDAKYAELTGFGYPSVRAPFVTSFGMYFALVDDPDGNTILLSADAETAIAQ
ncbi:MAG TPA: VOC family protein [Chloroflexia bacterium]|nr:VOC family protein [Chloroflexia bacterium]